MRPRGSAAPSLGARPVAGLDGRGLADVAGALAREDVVVWGSGPALPLESQPPGRRPSDLVAGARSLLCFALPVPRGVFEQPHAVETNWRTQNLYYRKLDGLSVRAAALLEERGERACPVVGCLPVSVPSPGSIAGYVDQIEMGVATRIGVRGRNGMLFHPRYGSRLMLGGVVTTADLPAWVEPAPVERGCPEGCRACVEACPVGAIRPEARTVDIPRCLRHTARTPFLPRWRFVWLSLTNPKRAARLLNQTSMDDHTLHVCSRCVSACPA